MKNFNYFFIILLWSCCTLDVLKASIEAFTPSFLQRRNSKIYMIKEINEECGDGQSIENISGKTSIDTMNNGSNEEKKQQFLDAIKSDNVHDLMNLLQADAILRAENFNDQGEYEIPFYVEDNKKDLIALKHDLSIDVYDYLIALGGGLTKEEYKLLENIESRALYHNQTIEYQLRKEFLQAISEKNIEKVKSLIDIDTCLRYQDFINQEFILKHGPLMKSLFDKEMTVLHYAILANSFELVDFFIKNGVSVNQKASLQKMSHDNSIEFRPTTPLDFAMVYREKIKNNHATPSIEFDRNRKIIDLLIASKAKLQSTDNGIQQLIDAYVTAKIQQPMMRNRLSVYQSIKNLLSSNAAKVSPM